MKLFGRKRPQRSADTSEKSPETVNVQSRDVSVAESDTEMMTENVYLGQEQYQPKELQVSAASLIGSRRNQQDSLCYTSLPDKGFLAVVCDGMGGLGGGELASYTACAGMVDAFEKCGDAQPADFFVRTASEIDVSVAGIADAEGVPIGAGTTLSAVWIKENCMHWISVGDSKIYLVRGHQTRCLTTPHNYKMLLDKRKQAGTITSEQYEAEFSRGEALISYIGMNGLKYMDVSMEGLELEAEDQIVLCSDGFYRQCPEENLAQCLENLSGDYETYASQLAEAVIRNQPRGMDNTTLILVRYSPEENEEKIREVNEENEKGDIKT